MSIRTKGGILGSAIFTITGDAFADWTLNLPEPVSPVTREIFNLHMLTATVALVIMVIVTAVIIYSLWKFRKSAGYEADQNFHTGWFGKWSWVLVPLSFSVLT
ncbi:cytochrome c oxidase subunit II transmembrane domain-containing protein [Solemya velum gill symbiont]|uniref:cytochrome c oxidase subunit II transmembrane domain-containing protein n=1 Tax=Solemya velum gill symbiont TaxID=2340 RepID=UPI002117E7C6|nr:cytochrome c oxidase subunit II transmembrane domain-containing protein [Solemya velum gill symbiont]